MTAATNTAEGMPHPDEGLERPKKKSRAEPDRPELVGADSGKRADEGNSSTPDFNAMYQRADMAVKARELFKLKRPQDEIEAVLLAQNRESATPLPEDEINAMVWGESYRALEEHYPPDSATPLANSEDALARELVYRAAPAGFRWTPGPGWMLDNGIVFERDTTNKRIELSRAVCRAAAHKAPNESKKFLTARGVNAIVNLAQSDSRLVVPPSAWDRDPLVLNTPGGVVDLRTGLLRPRGNREYLTQATSVAMAPEAHAPRFLRFIHDVCCGDTELVAFMKRMLGYCLSGSTREQVLFFWLGDKAGNGKTTLASVLMRIMGGYALKLPAAALMQSRGERHPTELAQLRGRRLAVSSELDDNSHFNAALLKELTGDPTLSARYMRGDFFEFKLTQKHVVFGNSKPRLPGGDPGIARRLVLVPFQAKFDGPKRIKDFDNVLMTEAPAILRWGVEGSQEVIADGLGIPSSVRAASDDYLADHDDLNLWLGECCVRDPQLKARASHLYQSFAMWKKARGEFAPSQTAWGSRLALVPGIAKNRSSIVWYTGVTLTVQPNDMAHHHD